MRSPREDCKSKRAPPEAWQARLPTHMTSGLRERPGDRPEAHAQTQTEEACLTNAGGTGAATCRQPLPPHQEKSHAACNEGAHTAGITFASSRTETREVAAESGAVVGPHSGNARGDQKNDWSRPDTESSVEREENICDEIYSCEGSEPEGRLTDGAETVTEEQTPQTHSGCSEVSATQSPEVAESTAGASPAQEMADLRRSADEREISPVKFNESLCERSDDPGIDGGAEVCLAPVPAGRINGGLEVEPPARGGDEPEGHLQTSDGRDGIVVVGHSSPPPSLRQSDDHPLRPTPSSDATRTSPTSTDNTEAEQMSQDAARKSGDADGRGREEKLWRTEMSTEPRNIDPASKQEVEVRRLGRAKLSLLRLYS